MNIDFEKYSLEDLQSSLSSIDREKFPENFKRLLAAIEKKKRGDIDDPGADSTKHAVVRTEIRLFLKIGALMLLVGIANFFLGLSGSLTGSMGAVIGGILDKTICVIMIAAGLWMLRKRLVVDGKSVRLIGLVEGNPDLKIGIDEIVSVGFNTLKQKVEIVTSAEKFLSGIPQNSEAHAKLSLLAGQKMEAGTAAVESDPK